MEYELSVYIELLERGVKTCVVEYSPEKVH